MPIFGAAFHATKRRRCERYCGNIQAALFSTPRSASSAPLAKGSTSTLGAETAEGFVASRKSKALRALKDERRSKPISRSAVGILKRVGGYKQMSAQPTMCEVHDEYRYTLDLIYFTSDEGTSTCRYPGCLHAWCVLILPLS